MALDGFCGNGLLFWVAFSLPGVDGGWDTKPRFHITPEEGGINDPNGLFYYKGSANSLKTVCMCALCTCV
eukprot:1337490-Amorphochlora_amoeboformis.AAC.1